MNDDSIREALWEDYITEGPGTEFSITCPKCGMTTYDPDDIEEGYCGKCHDWTGVPRDPIPSARCDEYGEEHTPHVWRDDEFPTQPMWCHGRPLEE